jgi:acetoacetyl-CoA synthetase
MPPSGQGISSLKKVVVATYPDEKPDLSPIPKAIRWEDFLSPDREPALEFEQLPFDQPVYIMFSSGTTGKPKCMVQGAGGILINHLKELILHTDLKREDRILYITPCSWMMWNWLISSLGVGATVVCMTATQLPDGRAVWKLLRTKVTIFRTSASYINYLRVRTSSPARTLTCPPCGRFGPGLPFRGRLRYAYQEIKKDLHFNSISGSTDINGCFAAGNIISPVYAGGFEAVRA